MLAKASRVRQSQGGMVAPRFMNSSPSSPAISLKNLLPTAFSLVCFPAALAFSAFSASFLAFSSLYWPKPTELKKLKKMFTPQVTGRVVSRE